MCSFLQRFTFFLNHGDVFYPQFNFFKEETYLLCVLFLFIHEFLWPPRDFKLLEGRAWVCFCSHCFPTTLVCDYNVSGAQ